MSTSKLDWERHSFVGDRNSIEENAGEGDEEIRSSASLSRVRPRDFRSMTSALGHIVLLTHCLASELLHRNLNDTSLTMLPAGLFDGLVNLKRL